MKRFLIVILILGLFAAGFIVLKKYGAISLSGEKKMAAVASFYPWAEFLRQIGGDRIKVISIAQPGVEPHEYEPTPQDIIRIYSAKLFVFNGKNMDPWAEKIENNLKEKGITIINMAEAMANDISANDPHFWLNPVLAQKEIEIIKNALVKIDSDYRASYEKNFSDYTKQLKDLDQKYRNELASCGFREIIVSHAAFSYLGERYNIKINAITGISPQEEPSIKRIAELASLAKDKKIKYIFFESLVNPRISEVIANEVGAQTLVLNPIEGLNDKQVKDGENYLTLMEENLANLRLAMNCQ